MIKKKIHVFFTLYLELRLNRKLSTLLHCSIFHICSLRGQGILGVRGCAWADSRGSDLPFYLSPSGPEFCLSSHICICPANAAFYKSLGFHRCYLGTCYSGSLLLQDSALLCPLTFPNFPLTHLFKTKVYLIFMFYLMILVFWTRRKYSLQIANIIQKISFQLCCSDF